MYIRHHTILLNFHQHVAKNTYLINTYVLRDFRLRMSAPVMVIQNARSVKKKKKKKMMMMKKKKYEEGEEKGEKGEDENEEEKRKEK